MTSPLETSSQVDPPDSVHTGKKTADTKKTKKRKTKAGGGKDKEEEKKEELPLYLRIKLEDMQQIQHNRLMFGEAAKDRKVTEHLKKRRADERNGRRALGRSVDGMRGVPEQRRMASGLKPPRQPP